MLSFPASVRIFVAVGVTDMRKSFDGLSAVAREIMKLDPLSGDLFAFCNRRRDRLKLLLWDRGGFWVFAKRLEEGTFAWPEHAGEHEALRITMKDLMCVIEGIDLRGARMRKRMERVPA